MPNANLHPCPTTKPGIPCSGNGNAPVENATVRPTGGHNVVPGLVTMMKIAIMVHVKNWKAPACEAGYKGKK